MKFCTQCGKELPEDAAFCHGCGEKQLLKEETVTELKAETDATSVIKSDECVIDESTETEATVFVALEDNETPDYIGKTCPFCKTEIFEDDEVITCPACDIAHHKSCWEENGGCTTFGCSGKTPGTIVCYNCGADLAENQLFCSKCGAPRPAHEQNGIINNSPIFQLEQKPTNCSNCGSPVSQNQEFCSKCGYRLIAQPIVSPATQNMFNTYSTIVSTKKTPKKGVVIGIVVAVVAIVAIITGMSMSNKKARRVEDYKTEAKEFSTLCWTCGKNIEDVGNDIQTYWNKYISTYGTKVYYNGHYMYSIDDAVAYALSDNSTTVATIKVEWSSIQKQYNNLKDVPDTGVDEIWRDIKEVYESMEDMYDCVINVSGNYTSYKSNFSKCDTNLANALKALDDDLD